MKSAMGLPCLLLLLRSFTVVCIYNMRAPKPLWGRAILDPDPVPRRLFCFGFLVILDVVCRCLSLFVLYINVEIGKNRR